LLKISEPFTVKNFILNYPASASPTADFPVPDPPYSNTPLDSFIGSFLNTKLYFKGLSTTVLKVFFTYLIPASLLKSIETPTSKFFYSRCPDITYLLN
jgi:hypothetical protein